MDYIEEFEKKTGYNADSCDKCAGSEVCKVQYMCQYDKVKSRWFEKKLSERERVSEF